jgi:hypothetical protein
MSKKQTRFIDLYLAGRAAPEDINDSIDAWHAGSGREPIYDHLGMTEEEYAAWLRDPDVLPQIARARREHTPLTKVIESANGSRRVAGAPDVTNVTGQMPRIKKLGASRK